MLNYYVLSDDLHGEVLVLLLVAHEVDFTESTSPNDTDQFKVIPCHLRHCLTSVQKARSLIASHQVSIIEEKLSV